MSDPETGAHVAAELGELYAQAPTEEEREKATTTNTRDVEVMQDLQEARKRETKKQATWPKKMLQSCTCWAEDRLTQFDRQ
eukprot:Skav215362  [mRNA]  locus=scaffold1391:569510:576268:- [translate_table: standard]